MKTLVFATALLLAGSFTSPAASTNELELAQLVSRYLPGSKLQPAPPAKPLALIAPSGDGLVLANAARENAETKKGLGYWVTPTMAFLGRQRIAVGTPDDADGVIKLLHVLWRNPEFVKQKIYNAVPAEGGWIVEVGRVVTNQATQSSAVVQAMQPYELVTDATGHVTEIRERAYPYRAHRALRQYPSHGLHPGNAARQWRPFHRRSRKRTGQSRSHRKSRESRQGSPKEIKTGMRQR